LPAKLQPALLGGLAIGVLTSLPIVNIVNLCCCAWVVFGGALAAYMMQQNHPAPVSAGDGAIVGVMAGAIGAVIGALISVPIAMAMGPFQMEMMERVLQSAQDMPPEVRAWFEQWRNGMMSGAAIGVGFVLSVLFSLCLYSVFGLFGGLIGAVMFRKTPPPPPAPPIGGFEPPPFTPPPVPPSIT
jgi:hypothetical protein